MKMTNVSHWVRQHRFSRGVAWFLFSAILLAGTTNADLTDNDIHRPPTTGPYDYNTFKPGTAGFPAVGGTYTDPVFGGVVKRLTNIGANANTDDLYAHHWANANGTLAFARTPGLVDITIVEVATGNVLYTGQPDGGTPKADVAWDALDPDIYYYYLGTNLKRRRLSDQSDATVKNFGAGNTLQANGGSLNTQSRDGRYFTVRYGGTNKVWDKVNDVIYSGSVPPLKSTGWVSITPDAKYLVVAAGTTASPNIEHYSYPINHNTNPPSIGSTPTQFWGLCGDHGVLSSASNGKNYFVTFNCDNESAVYRVDITLDQTGKSDKEQTATNQRLVPLTFKDAGHFSAVSKGAFADWVFMSTENFGDAFGSSTSGWTAYTQEIIAMNVVTLEVRRLAHHRSRGMGADYQTQPRVSSSWDGSVVIWASNYNNSSPTGYADLYAIQSPLGARIAPPQNLRFK